MITKGLIRSLWKWCKFTVLSVNCCEWANNKLTFDLSNKLVRTQSSTDTLSLEAWLCAKPKLTLSSSVRSFWQAHEKLLNYTVCFSIVSKLEQNRYE